jgi:hypothetical protein
MFSGLRPGLMRLDTVACRRWRAVVITPDTSTEGTSRTGMSTQGQLIRFRSGKDD